MHVASTNRLLVARCPRWVTVASRPGLTTIFSVLAAVQLLVAALVLGIHGAPGVLGGDFIAYYGASKQALAGDWAHLYALSAQLPYQQALLQHSGLPSGGPAIIPFDYPPPAALLFLPLAALPAKAALAFWLAANTACMFLAWRVMVRQTGSASFTSLLGSRPCLNPLSLFVLLPVDWGLLSGQPVGIILLLAELSFLAFAARHDLRGGVWLGLIALFKPQLVLVPLLGLLFLGRPRAIVGAALTGLAMLVLSLGLVGTRGLLAYLQLLEHVDPTLGNAAYSIRTEATVNWRAWIAAIPGIDSRTALALTIVTALLTIGAALLLCARRRDPAEFAPAYLALTAAGLVAGYHSHYQDLVLLLPPLLALFVGPPKGVTEMVVEHGSPVWAAPRGCRGAWVRPDTPFDSSVGCGTGPLAAAGSGRPRGAAPTDFGRIAAIAAAIVVIVGPSVAWLLVGVFALSWLHAWTFLATPGLLLVIVGVWRANGVEMLRSTRP